MSFDLSWLWNTINSVVGTIQSWFQSIWQVVEGITNTGQGIFSGLVAFGSQLWDAFIKGLQAIGEWIYNAFNWIWQGLVGLGQTLGGWLSTAFQWLAGGIQWLANALWSFGSWLYNGMVFIWNWIVNTAQAVWNAITGFFSGIAGTIGSWWGSVVSGINAWFTNLVVGIRNKIVQTIIADVSIYFGWKSMDRLIKASSLKDAGFSVLGLIGSPFVGYLFGNIVNGLIPTPSTTPIQIIPEITPFAYSPPSLTIETPSERIHPTQIPYTPEIPPTYGYTPVGEVTVSLPKPSYQSRWDAGKDLALSLTAPSYDREIIYEYYNAGDDLGSSINQTYMWAQTFTVGDADHYVSKLRLKLGKTWSGDTHPAKLRVSIRATQDGHPYGDDLISVDVPHANIPTVEGWVEIAIPPILLSANTKYAIVLKGIDVDEDHYFSWRMDSTDPTYALGNAERSTDGGATWTSMDYDHMFEVYGY